MVLTTLSKNSKLKIKDVNLNPSRMGIVKILKMMGVKIKIQNPKIYKNEKIGDIIIKSTKNIKPINCPIELNSSAIDEFLLIFLFLKQRCINLKNFRIKSKRKSNYFWVQKF